MRNAFHDRHARVDGSLKERDRHLAHAAADSRYILVVDNVDAFDIAARGRNIADSLVERERLARRDQLAVEVPHGSGDIGKTRGARAREFRRMRDDHVVNTHRFGLGGGQLRVIALQWERQLHDAATALDRRRQGRDVDTPAGNGGREEHTVPLDHKMSVDGRLFKAGNRGLYHAVPTASGRPAHPAPARLGDRCAARTSGYRPAE